MVIFIGSLVIGWTTMSLRLTAVEALAQENKTTLEIIRGMEIDLAVIKADLNYIKIKVQ